MKTLKECVFDYLNTHKRPVTITKLAKHFIASDSGIRRVLMELIDEGTVETVRSRPAQYKIK